MSKSWAKEFVNQCSDTKLVRVQQTHTGTLKECYQNALQHKNQTGSKMVAGWIVQEGKYSSNYPNNPNIQAFAVRHWWNKHRGRYVDTTPFLETGNMAYVVQQDQTEDPGWITADNEHDHVRYVWSEKTA